jgi:hypothetical protein
MSNQIISFKRKGVTSTFAPAETSSHAAFRNQTNSYQPKAILSRTQCNFCEENHNENTYEIKPSARKRIFGKKYDTTIVSLDWAQEEDCMLVNT